MVGVPHRPILPSQPTLAHISSSRWRANREQREMFLRTFTRSQGQDLCLTVLYVQYPLDGGLALSVDVVDNCIDL